MGAASLKTFWRARSERDLVLRGVVVRLARAAKPSAARMVAAQPRMIGGNTRETPRRESLTAIFKKRAKNEAGRSSYINPRTWHRKGAS